MKCSDQTIDSGKTLVDLEHPWLHCSQGYFPPLSVTWNGASRRERMNRTVNSLLCQGHLARQLEVHYSVLRQIYFFIDSSLRLKYLIKICMCCCKNNDICKHNAHLNFSNILMMSNKYAGKSQKL